MSAKTSVVKLRLVVDERTTSILDSQSRMCNWLYNQLVEKTYSLRQAYIETQDNDIAKILYTKRGLRNLVPGIKEENPFLKSVHSSCLKNVALRATATIEAYQKSRKGKRKGKQTGWIRFRSWGAKWFSLLYDEPNKGYRIEGNLLTLSLGLGEDRHQHSVTTIMPEAHVLKGKEIRNCRIIKDHDVFFAVFTVVSQLPAPKPIKKIITLDPNHKNLGYGVDNEGNAVEITAPYWLKQYDKIIDDIKSKRDRCKKKSYLTDVLDSEGHPTGKQRWVPSRRWIKYHTVLSRVLAKRRDQTKTFCYTAANKLCKKYDLIAVGDYTPHGGGITRKMRRGMNNRSLIGRFKQTLSWVAEKSGKHYLEYDEKGTTRHCHACHSYVPDGIPPNIRAWQCSQCETTHHRDENAAINGMKKVLWNDKLKSSLQKLQVPGSGRVLIAKRCAWRVLPSGVHSTPRGQDSGIATSAKKLNCLRGSGQSELSHAQV